MRRTLLDNVKSRCSEQRLNKKGYVLSLARKGAAMEEIYNTFVMRRKDGAYMNFFFEIVKHVWSAARFNDHEHFNEWINGHYKPDHPEEFEIVPLEITYKVVETDVQEV